ncbi:MAG: glycosyltransferase [Solobacterium sp.]|nr:glycosyltransferase [Solobacterium sp.]
MKIILINTFYNQESTGKLMHNFRNYLMEQGHQVLMLYGHGPLYESPDLVRLSSDWEGKVHNLLGRVSGMNGCFSPLATNKAIQMIRAFSPDLVYLGNLHGHYINIYRLYACLKELAVPVIQILWDEYMMTGACSFSYDCDRYQKQCHDCPRKKDYPISWFFDTSAVLQKKKQAAYAGMKIGFAGVPFTAAKAKQSSLLKEFPIFSIDEAVDQKNLFYPRDPSALRQELGISEGKTVILNVCPYPSYRKGGTYYLELAQACLKEEHLVFVHVGFKGDRAECPANFIPIGYISDQDRLAQFYSMADRFVCTSLAETQPNTCLEALSCGTPITGFDISGTPTCAEEPYGTFVPFADIAALKDVLMHTTRKTESVIAETRAYAMTRFSSDDYNKRLFAAGIALLKNEHPSSVDSGNGDRN